MTEKNLQNFLRLSCSFVTLPAQNTSESFFEKEGLNVDTTQNSSKFKKNQKVKQISLWRPAIEEKNSYKINDLCTDRSTEKGISAKFFMFDDEYDNSRTLVPPHLKSGNQVWRTNKLVSGKSLKCKNQENSLKQKNASCVSKPLLPINQIEKHIQTSQKKSMLSEWVR